MVTNLNLPPKPLSLCGMSTDTKPTTIGALCKNGDTTKLPNCSSFFEINTQKTFYFDADSGAWKYPS